MTEPVDYFGPEVAAGYDDPSSGAFAPEEVEPAADLLAEMAGDGRALEFAIGTGRIALPLARRGVPVSGIDLSSAMVERLRAKPDGKEIPVVLGDFSNTRLEGAFSLVYLVFNTIGNLTTQDSQVECFRNAAAHLEPGGRFLIEVGMPELRRLPPGQNAVPFAAGPRKWALDRYHVATQEMSSNYFDAETGSFYSIPFRYVWPAELDLMARLAGMRLRDRWEDWNRNPFGDESARHVSVWEKTA
ncbi:class I SAM-dependent DNA methyltransferase [Glycomyces salinus]|uniref:class I SAM-dependent DNA methyltransferase n=1 Tax=Glycomyces salinus TaxID=980294 RepID=UPI0027D9D0B0|nr:class I SAM-dependent methyltransferase [Glycomyces salinus]